MERNYGNRCPIGVFDSGMGGLSVLKEIISLMPNEDTLYYADSKNCPYGDKTTETVIALTETAVQKLINNGVKLIVIACNTASSCAIDYLRSKYDIPFVAMEPAVKPAAMATKSNVIAVLATKRTIQGDKLKQLCANIDEKIKIVNIIGEHLVDIVEQGKEESDEAYEIILTLTQKIAESGADQIVLGCTHYPFLERAILKAIGDRDIKVVNPAEAIARRARKLLSQSNMLNDTIADGKHLYISSEGEIYANMLSRKIELL